MSDLTAAERALGNVAQIAFTEAWHPVEALERIRGLLNAPEGAERVSEVQPLDTFNRFLVTAHQGRVLQMGQKSLYTVEEALQLAAALIVAAELVEPDVHALEVAVATVKAIRET